METSDEAKTFSELNKQFNILTQELEELHVNLATIQQHEEVIKTQEEMLRKEAYELNETVIIEQVKLENARKQVENEVEQFICEVNYAIGKTKDMFRSKDDFDEMTHKKNERNRRRKLYCQLKGEIGALLLYKEYQECVLSELDEAARRSLTFSNFE